MSFGIVEKSSLQAEQDHNSVPDSFYRGHDTDEEIDIAEFEQEPKWKKE